MATSKTILVLANSIKHYPCTCIAGREIVPIGVRYEIGAWIRPVSTHDEGGVSPSESRLKNGRQPIVMDFVELSLANRTNDMLQPENWFIDTTSQWQTVNKQYPKPSLNLLIESPDSLWSQKNEASDRVASTALMRRPPMQSIYLIQVSALKVRFGWRQWEGPYKARRRALFSYNGADYDIGITDPSFLEKYRREFPTKGKPANEFDVKTANGCCLCVGLAPEFNGYHYKVVATIIEA
jgi:hypothetical protein